jgi:hypothetical protein
MGGVAPETEKNNRRKNMKSKAFVRCRGVFELGTGRKRRTRNVCRARAGAIGITCQACNPPRKYFERSDTRRLRGRP